MADDRVAMSESVSAELTNEVVPPRFPCIVCGKETLEHVDRLLEIGHGAEPVKVPQRICSSALCRHVHENDPRK